MIKNLIFAGIFILLLLVSGFLIWQEEERERTPWQKDFAFKDTGRIHKIYIVNKSNDEVTLERQNGRWIVNSKYRAMPTKVNLLLASVHDVEVKYPVSKEKRDNVVKELSSSANKVELYTNDSDKPAKTFYVGGPTQDNKGTYMIMSKNGEIANQPYVTYIPGFKGYLTPRFFVSEKEWRHLRMFTYGYNQIKTVKVDYPKTPRHSFRVDKLARDSVRVTRLYSESSAPEGKLITTAARKFLDSFDDLQAEAIETKYNKKDSILATKPYAIIEVIPRQGDSQRLTIYHKPVTPTTKQQFTPEGERKKVDADRFFATLARNDDFYMIQRYVFGKVLRKYSDFFVDQQPT